MPYKVFKRGDKFKVFKLDADGQPTGEALGTHDSEDAAGQQVRAIYANEKKPKKEGDTDEEKEMMSEEIMFDPPMAYGGGPCSFSEMEEMEANHEMVEYALDLTGKFKAMATNIIDNPAIEDKGEALALLAKEYSGRLADMKPAKKRPTFLERAKRALGLEKQVEPQPEFYIWKSGDSYQWLTAYSNNRRDDDNPPEIISSQSHKEFDQAIEKGEWPMPELWLWHVPYPVGVTEYHAYDENTGFPVAAGRFLPGMEWAAEGVQAAGWDGVSHGMPTKEIRRDDADKTIIARHRTKEITLLPLWAAANKFTFSVFKEAQMSDEKGLPAHKREEFVKAFGEDRVNQIEAALQDKAKEADEAGIEKKEIDQAQPLTREEVAEAITPLIEMVKELKAELQAMKEAKPAEKEITPASLVEMLNLGSVIGRPETQVDGRSKEAKSGPEEVPAERGATGVNFIDSLIKANQNAFRQ